MHFKEPGSPLEDRKLFGFTDPQGRLGSTDHEARRLTPASDEAKQRPYEDEGNRSSVDARTAHRGTIGRNCAFGKRGPIQDMGAALSEVA